MDEAQEQPRADAFAVSSDASVTLFEVERLECAEEQLQEAQQQEEQLQEARRRQPDLERGRQRRQEEEEQQQQQQREQLLEDIYQGMLHGEF